MGQDSGPLTNEKHTGEYWLKIIPHIELLQWGPYKNDRELFSPVCMRISKLSYMGQNKKYMAKSRPRKNQSEHSDLSLSRLPCHVSNNMLYIKAYKEIFIGRYLKYLIGCLGFHPEVSMREMKQPLGFQLYLTNLDANCTKLMSHVIPHGIQSGEI